MLIAEQLKENARIAKEKAAARAALILQREQAHAALPEETRTNIDTTAEMLRTIFGDSADWIVYDNKMPTWEALPEANKQNWRAIASHWLATK